MSNIIKKSDKKGSISYLVVNKLLINSSLRLIIKNHLEIKGDILAFQIYICQNLYSHTLAPINQLLFNRSNVIIKIILAF